MKTYMYQIDIKCTSTIKGKFYAMDDYDADKQLEKIQENLTTCDIDIDDFEIDDYWHEEIEEKIPLIKNEKQIELFQ